MVCQRVRKEGGKLNCKMSPDVLWDMRPVWMFFHVCVLWMFTVFMYLCMEALVGHFIYS